MFIARRNNKQPEMLQSQFTAKLQIRRDEL